METAEEWKKFNKDIIEEFRANKGIVGGSFANLSLLLLHTVGAKSGLPRLNPLTYLADGERFLVLASKAGSESHPDWYYNIIVNPEVRVEVGTELLDAQATIAAEPERTALYEKIELAYPHNIEIHRKTKRIIPVVVLTRVL